MSSPDMKSCPENPKGNSSLWRPKQGPKPEPHNPPSAAPSAAPSNPRHPSPKKYPNMSGKKVLLVCTSASKWGKDQDKDSGAWYEEVACPYYVFKDAGLSVVIASPLGGPIPIDAGSKADAFMTDYTRKFDADADALAVLSSSTKLSDVDAATFDAVYLAGGHATYTDFPDNKELIAIVETLYNAGKVVAADCHGPVGLVNCKKADGTPLVSGLNVTGFLDTEEQAVGLDPVKCDVLPFSLQQKFTELGGNFQAGADWSSNAVSAGKLITGQNPQSSEQVAQAMLTALA